MSTDPRIIKRNRQMYSWVHFVQPAVFAYLVVKTEQNNGQSKFSINVKSTYLVLFLLRVIYVFVFTGKVTSQRNMFRKQVSTTV